MRYAILLALLTLGCSASDRPSAPSHSFAVQQAGAAVPMRLVANSATARALDSTCELARALTELTLDIHLARDSARVFAAPLGRARWQGCRYTASFTAAADSRVLPENVLDAAFRDSDWTPAFEYDAGGPADTQYAFRRGDALCHFAFASPAGEVQPEAVPDTVRRAPLQYELELRCTSPVPVPPA